MRDYFATNLIAAKSSVTILPKNVKAFNNDAFLANFHLEFTTEPPNTPRPNDDKSLAAEKNEISEEMGFSVIIGRVTINVLFFCR